MTMKAIFVSHSHWDREWYRTFQDFRARLVDLVDHVIELCEADPGYHFLLDGQTCVVEDYLEIRPDHADALRALCGEGRISIGPWYVQPDSLLPSGESHVRNLLLGRAVGEGTGPVSRVGYTPDSFGHPAQLPQILAGFGIASFVYWRGNGVEIDSLPAEWDWEAPDGSRVVACHLGKGYFVAATAPDIDLERGGALIAERARDLVARTRSGVILLLNGLDHAPPEIRSEGFAKELGRLLGFEVERGLLEAFVAIVLQANTARPAYRGELVGARRAPLLPGVWSTRTWIKLENRRAEAELEAWAEPFAALARRLGLADERPSLRLAWKELLKNQAHDSICGCSRDEVHEQMRARFDTARELAEQTTKRCLERIAGLGIDRPTSRSVDLDLFVANPSPRRRTDLVRFPLDFHPFVAPSLDPTAVMHPMLLRDLAGMGFSVDGVPARLVPAVTGRMKLLPAREGFDLEFVAREVPALGFRRVQVRLAPDALETADRIEVVEPGGPEARIEADGVGVRLREDGLFDLTLGGRVFHGLGELESAGDRGDTYDYDEVCAGPGARLESLFAERRRHPSGIQELRVRRRLRMPARLDASREARASGADAEATVEVEMILRVVPGVARLDLDLRVENGAEDHRLRMLFPVEGRVERFEAATTFDVVERCPGARAESGWVQAAPATFPHQGFVHAHGLSVVAPGLSEAEVIPGDPSRIAITLLRCVGSLSRWDLRSRPGPAGPGTDTPGAQCPGRLQARLSLFAGLDPARAREAEIGLRAVVCGEEPLATEGEAWLELEPSDLLLSACKPAERGEGMIVRVSNPTATDLEACLRFGFPITRAEPRRLDESAPTPASRSASGCGPESEEGFFPVEQQGRRLRFLVPARALRTVAVL